MAKACTSEQGSAKRRAPLLEGEWIPNFDIRCQQVFKSATTYFVPSLSIKRDVRRLRSLDLTSGRDIVHYGIFHSAFCSSSDQLACEGLFYGTLTRVSFAVGRQRTARRCRYLASPEVREAHHLFVCRPTSALLQDHRRAALRAARKISRRSTRFARFAHNGTYSR